jgi:hypothetical protein
MFEADKTFLFDVLKLRHSEGLSGVSNDVASPILVSRSEAFISRAPGIIRWGVTVLGCWFFVSNRCFYFKTFATMSVSSAEARLTKWQGSCIGPFRKWVQFYETLFLLHAVKPNVD